MARFLPSTMATIPFVAGLMTKGDKRAKNPPALDICVNVEFDDFGGLRTRYPYVALTNTIVGGGTISNARQIVEYGNELLCFTKTKLYSWSESQAGWVEKADHLAVKVDEETRFASDDDQEYCTRAELDGVIVYAWGANSTIYVAALDKETKSVSMPATQVNSANTLARSHLLALDDVILLFLHNVTTSRVNALVIDPADVSTSVAAALTAVGSTFAIDNYDVCRIADTNEVAIAQRLNPNTSYAVSIIDDALASVATSTKVRPCDGPIAISSTPSGDELQVIRNDGSNIEGDLLTSSLSDTHINQAIGTVAGTCEHIAAAHRTTATSGQYRCFVFWQDGASDQPTTDRGVRYNWVAPNNTLGTEAAFVHGPVGIASRAFDHGGEVYVNLVFAGESDAVGTLTIAAAAQSRAQLQNSHYLYRDDGHLCGKATMGTAAGFVDSGVLPGVQLTDGTTGYSWCGCDRRLITVGDTGGGYSYADRGPRDITWTFDSNEARRCVRFGQTLYVTGAEILQYDGAALTEVGFHYFPYYFEVTTTNGPSSETGDFVEAGDYYFKLTYRWTNACGERERSTTASVAGEAADGVDDGFELTVISPLNITHKDPSAIAGLNGVAIDIWRTLADPTDDAPYYLVSSSDPADASAENNYIGSDVSAGLTDDFLDFFTNVVAATTETNPENGGYLESLAPPPATIIAASESRLFLAGVAGDPDRVWYSRQRNPGEVASFHDALTFGVPITGGDITALAIMNETLVVFRETAIYMIPGDGFDNAGGGANYGPARTLSTDVGAVSMESVALVDRGLIFKSSKGWYQLSRGGFGLEYIGAPVADYDDEDPLAIHVVQSQHQIRILTSSRMLVLDTLVNQWGEWSVDDGLHACMWQGSHVYLTTTGPKQQQTTYTDVDYGWDIETAWIKVNELQGRGIVRGIELLGEYRAAHSIRKRIARNYESDGSGGWSYFDDDVVGIPTTTVGGQEQLKFAPSIKRPIQSLKVRLTALHADRSSQPAGDTARLTGLTLDVALEDGLFSGLSAAQKV
jgi:hypothetical protein